MICIKIIIILIICLYFRKTNKTDLKLAKMFVYPIKSCGAFSVESSWPITSTGLKYDREWMIVRNGVAVTQKQLPEMCMIFPSIDFEKKLMFLSYKGINFLRSNPRMKISIFYLF